MTPFPSDLGLKAPTHNKKDARFTFHTRRAVQSAIADLLVCLRLFFVSVYFLLFLVSLMSVTVQSTD